MSCSQKQRLCGCFFEGCADCFGGAAPPKHNEKQGPTPRKKQTASLGSSPSSGSCGCFLEGCAKCFAAAAPSKNRKLTGPKEKQGPTPPPKRTALGSSPSSGPSLATCGCFLDGCAQCFAAAARPESTGPSLATCGCFLEGCAKCFAAAARPESTGPSLATCGCFLEGCAQCFAAAARPVSSKRTGPKAARKTKSRGHDDGIVEKRTREAIEETMACPGQAAASAGGFRLCA